MEAVEFVFSAIAGALVTVGVALVIRPARMVGITGRRAEAIGLFTLYMVVSHHRCRACLAAPARHAAGHVLFRQSAEAARIRLVD